MEREVVIMTSVSQPKQLPFWMSKNYNLSQDIENRFDSLLKSSGYKVVYIHNANAETLSRYLESPSTLALFWISHASKAVKISDFFSLSSTITDISGNNLRDVFQKVNPNLKFLSILGCEAKSIINQFKKQKKYHPSFIIHSFEKKVSLFSAINQAIIASASVLDQSPKQMSQGSLCLAGRQKRGCRRNKIIGKEELFELEETEVIKSMVNINHSNLIIIKNTNPEYAAILTVNKEFIGVLKKGAEDQHFSLPNNLAHKKLKLKIKYEKSILTKAEPNMPLTIEGISHDYNVSYLQDKDGNVNGQHANYYYLNKVQ
ncbi:MAG: hypothetical protein HON90_07265 [Halobacteriovoraceae bacterium]|nr:hypothetical protein [Halobacteriovoraceae bacterium]